MKARAAHAPYRVACLCVFGVLAFAGGSPSARAQSAAPAAAPAAPAYEDRLIGGGTLTPDISSGDYLSTSDSSGLARSIRIDGVTSTLSQQGANAAPTLHENGYRREHPVGDEYLRRLVGRRRRAHRRRR